MNTIDCGSYLINASSAQAKKIIFEVAITKEIKKSDLFIIDEQNKKIKINKIREMAKKMMLKPQNQFSLFCIFNAHNLTSEAANSLLKILEEPANKSIILLFTLNYLRLLPTIRSRCKVITFKISLEKKIDKEYIKFLEELKTKKYIFEKFKLADVFVKDEVDIENMLYVWIKYLRKNQNNYSKITTIFNFLKIFNNSINKKLFLENLFIRL